MKTEVKAQVVVPVKFASENWAVFNGHVNDAGHRAIEICRARYGNEADAGMKELERARVDGIMAIFHHPPTPATQLYASACFIFANGLDKPAVS